MRTVGTGFELGVELTGDIPHMLGQLDHLDDVTVGSLSRQHHAVFLIFRAVGIVHLIAVTVAFLNEIGTVALADPGTGFKRAGIFAKPHRRAKILHVALFRHQIDDRIGGGRIEFGAVRVLEA